MTTNQLIFKKLFEASNYALQDTLLPGSVYKSQSYNECENWIKENSNNGEVYLKKDLGGAYLYVVQLPEFTDEELNNRLAIIQTFHLAEISKRTKKTHFWVKFWSVISLIGAAIGAIFLLANM